MQTLLVHLKRPNYCKHAVIIACTAIVCVLIIIHHVRLEAMTTQSGQGGATSPASLSGDSRFGSDLVETSTGGIHNLTRTRGIVEGIIAGSRSGVVVIPLGARKQKTISSTLTEGVAYNWQSRKVYWIEYEVGIKIANLDGSSAELLISGGSLLRGLAVDQITGNLYYGINGLNPRIRVCDSLGKGCVTVASEVKNKEEYMWDIALSPSEGLIFWSSPEHERSVTRANMDGTNATVIMIGDIYGIYFDEFTKRLYWANSNGSFVGHCDSNGNNQNVLFNSQIFPSDIAVDGDTLIFSAKAGRGVYSFTNNGKVSSIAKTTGYVNHIALYGGNNVFSRPNPCKYSPCENLCVLTRVSYTCL